MNTASKTRHVFILFLADIVWGIAFVAQSKGGDAVGAEISPPQLQLAPFPSLFGRVGVHRLTRQHRQCLLPPKAAPVQTGSIHSA